MKLTAKKYAQALAQLLAEKDVTPKTVAKHFIDTLRRRKQTKLLPSILKHVQTEWCKANGITQIEVEYAPKFKDSLEAFENALKDKNVLVHATPREDLIGGYRIKIDDLLIDASLKGRLNTLAHQLRT